MKINRIKKSFIAILTILALTLGILGNALAAAKAPAKKPTLKLEKEMTLATTTSTQDSGLLDVLVPAFEKKYKVKVKVVAVGTGAAIEMGKKGDADVLLVHSRKDEDQFMKDGYGSVRKDVMHNEFYIIGPAKDPAKIGSAKSPAEALKKIANAKSTFISRGDNSGTHKKEKTLWSEANLTPSGSWYVEAGQGMGETLTMANEMSAYTLVDAATYLSMKSKLSLKILYKGHKSLYNPYGIIMVNQKKFPNVHRNTGITFVNFVIQREGQLIIKNFGKAKYGQPLFYPDALPNVK